jgi:hypothetical protein
MRMKTTNDIIDEYIDEIAEETQINEISVIMSDRYNCEDMNKKWYSEEEIIEILERIKEDYYDHCDYGGDWKDIQYKDNNEKEYLELNKWFDDLYNKFFLGGKK